MKRSEQNRQALLAALLSGSIVMSATGCANSGSRFAWNPFSKKEAVAPALQTTPDSATEKIADGTKTMWKRSGEAVTGMFASHRKKADEKVAETSSDVDPLRLDHKSEVTPEVLVANGRLWESTGNAQKAMENYTKALELEADYPDALTNIARLHFRQGNHQQAADFFGRAIKKSPEDAGLFNDLGLTLSKLGNHAAAQQTLSRALQLAPGTSRYANNLASVKFESGDKQAAFQVLQENNQPAVAHFNMAYLHYKNGQVQDAQQHLTQVMQYESQAGKDPSVKQAVDRSREMLAQITPPEAQIAQNPNVPSVTISDSEIRQTSQAATPDAKAAVAPAAGPAIPSAQMIKPSLGIEQVTPPISAIPAVKPTVENKSSAQPAAKPATSTPPTQSADAQSAKQDSGAAEPFALPPGFGLPGN